MSYTIVALPEDNVLKELQSIRDYFYQNNFRYNNKPVSDLAHISLSVISDNMSDWFISDLTESFKWEESFTLSNFLVHTEEHKRIYDIPEKREKYPNWCWWFTILFPYNEHLINTSKKIIDIADKYWIDETFEYARTMAWYGKKDTNNINIHDFIANHMNICNYIRLEKMEEAKAIFESQFKHNSILIDRIWIRKLNESGDIIHEIKLK